MHFFIITPVLITKKLIKTMSEDRKMYLCWLQKRNWSSFWTKNRQTCIL